MVVDSDLASILSSSRFSKYFRCENAENAVIETAENVSISKNNQLS